MKTIYLKDENGDRVGLKYKDISELKEELEKRNISIGDGANIGYRANIGNDVKLQRNLYIVGSKHSVTYTGNNTLSIGCHNFTIDKWLEKFKIIGEKEGYTEEQILEYETYIKMAKQFNKLNTQYKH